jgi:outer membrane lipoprotein-sorting protein
MRRVFMAFSLAALVLAASHPSSVWAQSSQSASPTADDIVAKNIEAKGGAAKLKSVESVRIMAAATVQGTIAPMVIELKRPNLRRQEVTVNGQKIVQTFDGANGWMLNPSVGEQPIRMPAAQSAAMKNDAEFDSPLLDYQSKGVKVALVGREDVDGRPAYHLKVTTADGVARDYYVDAQTNLEFRVDAAVMQNGTEARLSVAMSDYRDVDGVKMPFSLKQSLNGREVADLQVSTIEFNVPLDASLFRLGDGK